MNIIPIISEPVFKRSMDRLKITDYDMNVLEYINLALNRYITNYFTTMSALMRQNGGKIVLPSEYFGLESGSYTNIYPPSQTSQATSTMARLPMKSAVLQPVFPTQAGGVSRLLFSIPTRAWSNALKEKGYSIKFAEVSRRHAQEMLNKAIDELYQIHGSFTLDKKMLRSILKKKLYRVFGEGRKW